MSKCILGVGAHPDDLEIFAGGTLAKYTKKGNKVFLCHVATGNKGTVGLSTQEAKKVRGAEAKASANLIGAESFTLGLSDSEIFNDLAARIKMIDLFRKLQPYLIITHCSGDYHPDHRVVSELVCDAAYVATSFGFKTKYKALEEAPAIYFMDTSLGVNFIPNEYIDISDFIEVKKEMLLKHQSQFKHRKKREGSDLLEDMLALSEFRGRQCGVSYAEGFRPYLVWPHLKPRMILP